MRRALFASLFCLIVSAQALAAEHDFAVVIGNRDYGTGIPEVSYAHNDANAISRMAIELLGVRDGNVITVEDASQAEMESLFGNERAPRGKIARWITPGETNLIVYYSGHGVPGQKDGRGYLLPVDADPDAAEINGFPLETLYENLAELGAKSVTIILEACFTGDSAGGALITGASPIRIEAKFPDVPKGMTILTAAEADQLANWSDQHQLGLFTYHLLTGLYGEADQNRDDHVTLGEIGTHLDKTLTYDARRLRGRVQHASLLGEKETQLSALISPMPELPLPEAGYGGLSADQLVSEQIKRRVMTVVHTPLLNKPKLGAGRLGVIPAETRLLATEEIGGQWLKVMRADKELGFIHRSAVQELYEPKPEQNPTSVAKPLPRVATAPLPMPEPIAPPAASPTEPVQERPASKPPKTDDPLELAFWQAAQSQGTKEAYEAYLEAYPTGVFAALAKLGLKKPLIVSAPQTTIAPPTGAQPKAAPAEELEIVIIDDTPRRPMTTTILPQPTPPPAPPKRDPLNWALVGNGENNDLVHIWAAKMQRKHQNLLADNPVYLHEFEGGRRIGLRIGPMSEREIADLCKKFEQTEESCRLIKR